MSEHSPWGTLALEEGEDQRVTVGPLALTLRRASGEIWLFHAADGEPAPEESEWSRWALADPHGEVRLSPVFPDRVIVVNPEHPFTLLRKAEARIYVRIPVFVRVTVGSRKDAPVLTELPTLRLSDTWWGDFLTGQIAYWLPTRARRTLEAELFESHFAITTLQLENHSDAELPVEKLALRVEHLGLYEKEGALWGEETRVEYHGENEGSDIEPEGRPPAEAQGAALLTPARVATGRFRSRTFARLKALSGMGG